MTTEEEIKVVFNLRVAKPRSDGTVKATAKTAKGFSVSARGQTREDAIQIVTEKCQLLHEYQEYLRMAYNAKRKAQREARKV